MKLCGFELWLSKDRTWTGADSAGADSQCSLLGKASSVSGRGSGEDGINSRALLKINWTRCVDRIHIGS